MSSRIEKIIVDGLIYHGHAAVYLGELGSVRDGGADIIEHKGGIVVDDLLRGSPSNNASRMIAM